MRQKDAATGKLYLGFKQSGSSGPLLQTEGLPAEGPGVYELKTWLTEDAGIEAVTAATYANSLAVAGVATVAALQAAPTDKLRACGIVPFGHLRKIENAVAKVVAAAMAAKAAAAAAAAKAKKEAATKANEEAAAAAAAAAAAVAATAAAETAAMKATEEVVAAAAATEATAAAAKLAAGAAKAKEEAAVAGATPCQSQPVEAPCTNGVWGQLVQCVTTNVVALSGPDPINIGRSNLLGHQDCINFYSREHFSVLQRTVEATCTVVLKSMAGVMVHHTSSNGVLTDHLARPGDTAVCEHGDSIELMMSMKNMADVPRTGAVFKFCALRPYSE